MPQPDPAIITLADESYPPLLRAIAHPPEALYALGDLSVLQTPCISVVGSRRMTAYGEKVARLFLPGLVQAGLTIVSGLAYGVDGFAHRVTLREAGRGVAVLGSGFSNVYPYAHRPLFAELLRNRGCALTEYEPAMDALPYHFPARNRIIAGLSRVILIIEAGKNSGTLITARQALDSGREVCVVPADITQGANAGSIQLLKEGAKPVSCLEDILRLYSMEVPIVVQDRLRPALTGSMATLYDSISSGIQTTGDLLRHTGLSVHEMQGVLTVLELDGYISYKEQRWQKIL